MVDVLLPIGSDGDVIELKDVSANGSPANNIVIIANGSDLIEDPSNPTASLPFGSFARFVGNIPKEGYRWEFCANVNGGTWLATLDFKPKAGTVGNGISNTVRLVVKDATTIVKDTGVSMLANGEAIQGYTFPGTTNIAGAAGNEQTVKLNRAGNTFVALYTADDGSPTARVIMNNANLSFSNNRPTYGTPLAITARPDDTVLVALDATHFAVISVTDGGATDTIGVRVYSVAAGPTFVITEGAEVTTIYTPSGSPRIAGVSLNSGAEFVLLFRSSSAVYMRHYTIAGTTLTASAAAQATVYTPSSTNFEFLKSLEMTSTVFTMTLEINEITEVVAVSWTSGTTTFAAGTALTPTWTPNTNSVRTTTTAFISSSVMAIASGNGRYTTISLSGTTLTAETSDAAIYSNAMVGSVDIDAVDSSNILASGKTIDGNVAVHGIIGASSPFAIVWGTPIVYRHTFSGIATSIQYTTSTRAALCGNDSTVSLEVDQVGNTVIIYESEGPMPIGLAQQTVSGNGVATVDVTTFGNHTTTASLSAGNLYVVHGNGAVNVKGIPDSSVVQRYDPHALGVATDTNNIFVVWPRIFSAVSIQ